MEQHEKPSSSIEFYLCKYLPHVTNFDKTGISIEGIIHRQYFLLSKHIIEYLRSLPVVRAVCPTNRIYSNYCENE